MVNGQLDLARIGSGGREIGAFPAGVVTTANRRPPIRTAWHDGRMLR